MTFLNDNGPEKVFIVIPIFTYLHRKPTIFLLIRKKELATIY